MKKRSSEREGHLPEITQLVNVEAKCASFQTFPCSLRRPVPKNYISQAPFHTIFLLEFANGKH